MTTYVIQLLSGAMGAALVTGLFALIQSKKKAKDANTEALRYLMLYVIQERAKQHLKEGYITMEERHILHAWHDTYHSGLGGNGDADAIMESIDKLPLRN